MSLKNISELFKNPEKSYKQYEKAKHKKFFLNLADSHFPIEKWLFDL